MDLTCCRPVAGWDSKQRLCGSNGHGYVWVSGSEFFNNVSELVGGSRISEVDRGVELRWTGLLLLAVSCVGVGLFWRWKYIVRLQWSFELVSYLFAAFGVIGFGLASALSREVLFLSPSGWMCVSTIFSSCYYCNIALCRFQLEYFQPDHTGKKDGHQWIGLLRYSTFAMIALSQQKMTWTPMVTFIVPLAGILFTRFLHTFSSIKTSVCISQMFGYATLLHIAPIIGPATGNGPRESRLPEIFFPNATYRLFATTMWPLIGLMVSEVLISKSLAVRARMSLLLTFSLIALTTLGPAFFEEDTHTAIDLLFAKGSETADRFCCVDPFPTAYCTGVYITPLRQIPGNLEPAAWSAEVALMIIITVVTNLSGMAGVGYTWNTAKEPFMFVSAFATFVTSSLYHLAQILNGLIMGMSEGNWHRLDNIFAVLSFAQMFLYPMDIALTPRERDILRSFLLPAIIYFQEVGPWNPECMAVPLVSAILISLFFFYRNPHLIKPFMVDEKSVKDYKITSILLCFGVVAFIKGLDDENDYLRLSHGIWHFLAGIAGYYMVRGTRRVLVKIPASKRMGYKIV